MENLFDFSKPGLAETLAPSRITESSWTGHIPFAYYLVEKIKPKLIVELGVHTGNSFFAFCDAVKALKLKCECIGIDTFKGDPHSGYYGDDVYKDVYEFADNFYGSKLWRMTFDEAVHRFDDRSIDILHIDGCHTYEETKHNFETWIRKVKLDGFILFHDTIVIQKDFGVWKFWGELEDRVPNHAFNFIHSCGLGVLKHVTGPWVFNDPEKALKYFEDLGDHIKERKWKNPERKRLSGEPIPPITVEASTEWKLQENLLIQPKIYPIPQSEYFPERKELKVHDRPSVCLTFICRDNAATIERMIRSCAFIIDKVVAVDTGSVDKTLDIIVDICDQLSIPYKTFSDKWVNFGHNRTLMMQHAKGEADYLFVMDTDEELEIIKFDRSELTCDIAMIPTRDGTSSYYRDRIFSDRFPWKWIGAAHEFAQGEGAQSKQNLEGLNLKLYPKTGNGHIQRNYDLLLGDYEKNPHDSRTLFYLGQSAYDLGMNEEALKFFKERSDIPFYPEESWYALYRQGQIYERMQNHEQAEITFLKDYSRRPSRMEPMFALAHSVAHRGDHIRACAFFELAIQIPFPKGDQLFVEDYLYEYNCAFWYTISLYYTGRFQQSFDMAEKLANEKKDRMPADVYDRHLRNIMWCEQQLVKQGWRERFIICPADLRFDGLGDNLLHSHLARLAQKAGYKKIYLSSLMKFKTPGTKEVVYLNNPCVDGEIERYGLQCENQWAKNILSGDVPTFDMEYMKMIALSHGFYQEGSEYSPVAFIFPVENSIKFEQSNITETVFDGYGKTNIVSEKKVKAYFAKFGYPSWQITIDNTESDINHSNAILKRIWLDAIPEIHVKDINEYVTLVRLVHHMICLTSATAILHNGITDVLTDSEWLKQPMARCHMRPGKSYINLDQL